ncbi:uncharacterized protein ABDE67_005290 [Symphorus nematophorus]
MKFLLPLVMLTACAAVPQDLSGKMFTFPQQTKTAHVKLITTREDFSAVTVCLRSFTDLDRDHGIFSLATPSADNDFLIFWHALRDEMKVFIKNIDVLFGGVDYKLNTWHSICSTWDSESGQVQLWFDGQPLMRKFVTSGSNIRGPTIIILGQEQDSHGGGFVQKQSFIGMMSDVHMWDYVLSHCEINNYMDDLKFTPGTVLNWGALEFQIVDRVLIEDKQITYLSGKMFTFPQETNTARVKLIPAVQDFSAATVCHRSFTDLKRDHILFSLATSLNANGYLIFWDETNKEMEPHIRDKKTEYRPQDYKPNMWHSICTTWDSVTGLVQLWFDGQPSIRKFSSIGSSIRGSPIIILLGQEQDSHGGGFDQKQSFVGMMTDVYMWDYVLSPCEIHNYMDDISFTPGNVLNWRALEFEIVDRVLIEDKQMTCH